MIKKDANGTVIAKIGVAIYNTISLGIQCQTCVSKPIVEMCILIKKKK